MANSSSSSGGIGFGGALALLFIGLKLGGVINWSWWWVLSPIWIPLALLVFIILIYAFVKASQ
jgi:hypothetical protein